MGGDDLVRRELGVSNAFASGAAVATVDTLAMAPHERVKTFAQRHGVGADGITRLTWRTTARQIWVAEGAAGFGRGLGITWLRQSCNLSLKFGLVAAFANAAAGDGDGDPTDGGGVVWRRFAAGAVAGAIAALVTNPLDLLKSRVQGRQESGGLRCVWEELQREVRRAADAPGRQNAATWARTLFRGAAFRTVQQACSTAVIFGVHGALMNSFASPKIRQ